jgi:hypothetical protein
MAKKKITQVQDTIPIDSFTQALLPLDTEILKELTDSSIDAKPVLIFEVKSSNGGTWNTLRKQNYQKCLQTLYELLDNAFASGATRIYLVLNFEERKGSIEDNGRGFGRDPLELSRCFTYGNDSTENQTLLNEHGCGMKAGLAVLDPNDKFWSVTWKDITDFLQVSAPYAREHFEVNKIKEWPGTILDPTGTIIQFPFHKENLAELYNKKNNATFKEVIPKLKADLSHNWMFFQPFVTGKVELFVNGEKVKPFQPPTDHSEYVSEYFVKNTTLKGGATLHMRQYKIENNIPDSPWFKKALATSGAYLFKNGRLISKVNSGPDYIEIFGMAPHPAHNGIIVVANVEGDPKRVELPITSTTKNSYATSIPNPVYDEMIDFMKKNIERVAEPNVSEEKLLDKFTKTRRQTFESVRSIKHEITTETCLKFPDTTSSCPSLDAFEIVDDDLYVYEAKKENKVSLQNILQMYGNYILATTALREAGDPRSPFPVILINAEDYKLPDTLENTIKGLHNACNYGFPVEIWNYDAKRLFKN